MRTLSRAKGGESISVEPAGLHDSPLERDGFETFGSSKGRTGSTCRAELEFRIHPPPPASHANPLATDLDGRARIEREYPRP